MCIRDSSVDITGVYLFSERKKYDNKTPPQTPPVPETAAAPIPVIAGDPIGLASEEDDFEPEPATPAKPAESVQAATQEMGWGDEDETTPVEVAAEDAGDDDDD